MLNKTAKIESVTLIFDDSDTGVPMAMIYKNGSIHYLKTKEMSVGELQDLWEADVVNNK